MNRGFAVFIILALISDAVDSCIQDEAPSNDLPYYAAIRDIISSRWVQDLYLVRHGETDYNREGRLGGDPSLTAKGIEQAEKLAAHFDGVDLPYIFTSTKQRSARRPRRCCVRVRTPSAWP